MAFVVKYNVLLILNLNIFTDYTLSLMLVLIFSSWGITQWKNDFPNSALKKGGGCLKIKKGAGYL